MKNRVHLSFLRTGCLLTFLMLAVFSSCKDDDATGPSGVTVQGTLNLPSAAAGKIWGVLIDNDLNGDNGYVQLGMGTCGTGLTVPYTINNVPRGVYYIYAVVFIVGDEDQGPQVGDFIGIYGGQIPDNTPVSPNATVGTGENKFDIDLYLIQIPL